MGGTQGAGARGNMLYANSPCPVLSQAVIPKARRVSKQISTESKTKPDLPALSKAFHLPPPAFLIVMPQAAIQEMERKTCLLKEQA